MKEELQTVMLGGEWELQGSSLAPVPLQCSCFSVPSETLSLWKIQTLSFSTVFIDYS